MPEIKRFNIIKNDAGMPEAVECKSGYFMRYQDFEELERERIMSDYNETYRIDRKVREATERIKLERHWLNGWQLLSDKTRVLVGTVVRCSGCGMDLGCICVAFPDNWEPPGPEPVWPFAEDGCPVCILQNRSVDVHFEPYVQPQLSLQERLGRFKKQKRS